MRVHWEYSDGRGNSTAFIESADRCARLIFEDWARFAGDPGPRYVCASDIDGGETLARLTVRPEFYEAPADLAFDLAEAVDPLPTEWAR